MEKPEFLAHYVKDENPLSGNMKRRKIFAPNKEMREVHKLIIARIRSLGIPLPNATGAVEGGSPSKNVLAHRLPSGKFGRYFYLLDLSSAYKNVVLSHTMVKLRRLYPETFDDDFVHLIMTNCLITEEGLVTGGNASPDIFNLCMEYMVDCKMRALAWKHSMIYTRYLDDLTFSADEPIGKRKRNSIIRILQDADCVINHGKTHVLDLSDKRSVQITGIGMKADGHLFVPRQVQSELRGLLHRAITKGDVPPAILNGKVGIFVHLMRSGLLDLRSNQTEKKLYKLYREYQNKRQD